MGRNIQMIIPLLYFSLSLVSPCLTPVSAFSLLLFVLLGCGASSLPQEADIGVAATPGIGATVTPGAISRAEAPIRMESPDRPPAAGQEAMMEAEEAQRRHRVATAPGTSSSPYLSGSGLVRDSFGSDYVFRGLMGRSWSGALLTHPLTREKSIFEFIITSAPCEANVPGVGVGILFGVGSNEIDLNAIGCDSNDSTILAPHLGLLIRPAEVGPPLQGRSCTIQEGDVFRITRVDTQTAVGGINGSSTAASSSTSTASSTCILFHQNGVELSHTILPLDPQRSCLHPFIALARGVSVLAPSTLWSVGDSHGASMVHADRAAQVIHARHAHLDACDRLERDWVARRAATDKLLTERTKELRESHARCEVQERVDSSLQLTLRREERERLARERYAALQATRLAERHARLVDAMDLLTPAESRLVAIRHAQEDDLWSDELRMIELSLNQTRLDEDRHIRDLETDRLELEEMERKFQVRLARVRKEQAEREVQEREFDQRTRVRLEELMRKERTITHPASSTFTARDTGSSAAIGLVARPDLASSTLSLTSPLHPSIPSVPTITTLTPTAERGVTRTHTHSTSMSSALTLSVTRRHSLYLGLEVVHRLRNLTQHDCIVTLTWSSIRGGIILGGRNMFDTNETMIHAYIRVGEEKDVARFVSEEGYGDDDNIQVKSQNGVNITSPKIEIQYRPFDKAHYEAVSTWSNEQIANLLAAASSQVDQDSSPAPGVATAAAAAAAPAGDSIPLTLPLPALIDSCIARRLSMFIDSFFRPDITSLGVDAHEAEKIIWTPIAEMKLTNDTDLRHHSVDRMRGDMRTDFFDPTSIDAGGLSSPVVVDLLRALSSTHPSILKSALRVDSSSLELRGREFGSYQVRVSLHGSIVDIVIDSFLPTFLTVDSFQSIGLRSGDRYDLMLIEKVLAKIYGSYKFLRDTCRHEEILSILTGAPIRRWTTTTSSNTYHDDANDRSNKSRSNDTSYQRELLYLCARLSRQGQVLLAEVAPAGTTILQPHTCRPGQLLPILSCHLLPSSFGGVDAVFAVGSWSIDSADERGGGGGERVGQLTAGERTNGEWSDAAPRWTTEARARFRPQMPTVESGVMWLNAEEFMCAFSSVTCAMVNSPVLSLPWSTRSLHGCFSPFCPSPLSPLIDSVTHLPSSCYTLTLPPNSILILKFVQMVDFGEEATLNDQGIIIVKRDARTDSIRSIDLFTRLSIERESSETLQVDSIDNGCETILIPYTSGVRLTQNGVERQPWNLCLYADDDRIVTSVKEIPTDPIFLTKAILAIIQSEGSRINFGHVDTHATTSIGTEDLPRPGSTSPPSSSPVGWIHSFSHGPITSYAVSISSSVSTPVTVTIDFQTSINLQTNRQTNIHTETIEPGEQVLFIHVGPKDITQPVTIAYEVKWK